MVLKKGFFLFFYFFIPLPSGTEKKGGSINNMLWSCSGGGSGCGNEMMFAAKD